MSREEKTAIHEAGHAVAHIRYGIDHNGATIVSDPDRGLLGAAAALGADSVWDKAAAESQVIAFCAGYAALVAAGCPPDAAVEGADDDFAQATELLEFWGLEGALQDWQARTVEVMQRPENVAAVSLLARHLLERKTLDGDHCEVLVEVADGVSTEADLARYLVMRGLT